MSVTVALVTGLVLGVAGRRAVVWAWYRGKLWLARRKPVAPGRGVDLAKLTRYYREYYSNGVDLERCNPAFKLPNNEESR